jgi:hypothetical protein
MDNQYNYCLVVGALTEGTARLAAALGMRPVPYTHHAGNEAPGGHVPAEETLAYKLYANRANTVLLEGGAQALLSVVHDLQRAHASVHMFDPGAPALRVYTLGDLDLVAGIAQATETRSTWTAPDPAEQAAKARARIDMSDPAVAAVAQYLGLAPREDGTTAAPAVQVQGGDGQEPWTDPAPTAWRLPDLVAEALSQVHVYDVKQAQAGFTASRLLAGADGLSAGASELLAGT